MLKRRTALIGWKPKRRVRVVSKWRYLGHLSTKTVLRSAGCLLMLLTVILGMFTVFAVVDHFYPRLIYNELSLGSQVAMLLGLAVFGAIAIPILGWLGRLMAKVDQKERVVPLTRNTVAELSAAESLVRASAEPLQKQEKVLLRPAQESQDTLAEELLRAYE